MSLFCVAELYEGLSVLKSDRARGLDADANKFVKEDAAVRVAPRSGMSLRPRLGLRHDLGGIIIPQAIAPTTCARSRAA
jgi:hypothetical protein